LKNGAEKAKGASSLGLTKKSFRKEIDLLAKVRPKKKILDMFAIVLQEEHNKLDAKNNKKIKKRLFLTSPVRVKTKKCL
jgi:hypothetical protein